MLIRLLAVFLLMLCAPALAYGDEGEPIIVMADVVAMPETANAEISYSDFIAAVNAGEVTSVAIPPGQRSLDGVMADGTAFSVIAPIDREFADGLVAAGIETSFTNVWKTDVFQTSSNLDSGAYLFWGLMEFAPFVIFIAIIFLLIFFLTRGSRRRNKEFADRLIALLQSSDEKLDQLLIRLVEAAEKDKTTDHG